MFYIERGLKNAKFIRGGGTIVALSLAVLGGSVFSFGNIAKAGNGSRIFGTGSNPRINLGKRGISEVSGGKSSYPGSFKRQIVSMTYPGDYFLNGTTEDTWITQNRNGGSVVTLKSSGRPLFLGWDGNDAVYQLKTQGGGLTSIKIPSGTTGWSRRKDIIWVNEN